MLLPRVGLLPYLISIFLTVVACSEQQPLRVHSPTSEIDSTLRSARRLIRTDRDSCIALTHRAIQKSKDCLYLEGEADGLAILGICQSVQGNNDSAIQYHRRAYDIRKKTSNPIDDAKSLSNIGEVYQNLSELNASITYFDSAYHIYLEHDSLHYLPGVLGNKAITYDYKDENDSARKYFQLAMHWAEKAKVEPEVLLSAYKNYGIFSNIVYGVDSSIKYVRKAMDLASMHQMDDQLPGLYHTLSYLLIEKGDYESAVLNAKTALKQANKFNLINLKEKIFYVMAHDTIVPDWQNKVQWFDSLISASNEIIKRSKIKDFAEFEVKYATAETKAKNKILIAEAAHRSRQRNLVFFLLLVVLILGAFVLRNQRLKRLVLQSRHQLAQKRIEELLHHQENQRMEDMVVAEERERIRIGQELHDRVGSLLGALKLNYDTIWEQSEKFEKLSSPSGLAMKSIIKESIDEVRRISHNMSGGLITKFGLSESLQRICDEIEASGRIHVAYYPAEIKDFLNSSQEITLFRALQEVIGNVLKHSSATFMEVSLNRSESAVIAMVEDDGVGFDPKMISRGIGIQNITSRMESINGCVHFDSGSGGGTTVTLEVPIAV